MSEDQNPQEDNVSQEFNLEVLKISTQRLAEKAQKIGEMVKKGEIENSPQDNFHLMKSNTGEEFDLHYRAEDMRRTDGNPVTISFEILPRSPQLTIGVDAKYKLSVGIHNDEDTDEPYRELAQQNPSRAILVSTDYFFDEEGNLAKVSAIPQEMRDKRKPIDGYSQRDRRLNLVHVFSKMTPSDFELAGRALQTIMDKANPQTPQTPEP